MTLSLSPTAQTINMLMSHGKGLIKRSSVDYPKAMKMVEQGAANITHVNTIFKLYDRQETRLYVLERDGWICRYCHGPAHTMHYMELRSLGGITSPVNCISICGTCKADKQHDPIYSFLQTYGRLHPILDWPHEDEVSIYFHKGLFPLHVFGDPETVS